MRRQELHGDEDGRVRYETEGCEIFAVEMESDGFPEVLRYLIQRLSLGDDRDFKAFSHVPRLLARTDYRLDRVLEHQRPPCWTPV